MSMSPAQMPAGSHAGGKDLADLSGLSRAPLHSLWRRLARPTAPRAATGAETDKYPALAKFSSGQAWRWIVRYVRDRFGRKHPFQTYAALGEGVYPLGEGEIRLALAGDWGTGTDEAALVAGQMAKFDAHYTIHLGDVYYMGDEAEVAENFLGEKNRRHHFTPVTWPRGSRGSFTLLGNHEMYGRGVAYFTRMLPWLGPAENGAWTGQKASFFCLENAFWRVIGLDTGYNSVGLPVLEYLSAPDCALPAPLMDWLANLLRGDDRRGVVLLSHHQYFSKFDNWYVKPAAQLAPFFPRPVLWFWGHEHRLTVYDQYGVAGGLQAHGRCIGHGGMPVDPAPANPPHPECPVLFLDGRLYPNNERLKVGYNGFARLTFAQARLLVEYVDLHGAVLYAETWTAAAHGLERAAAA